MPGISKIVDPSGLLEALAALSILPESAAILIVTLLLVLEIGLAALLVLRITPRVTIGATLALFSGFLLFSIYGVAVGIDADCGCFGSALSGESGPGMILRNAAFAGMAGWVLYGHKIIEAGSPAPTPVHKT